MSSPNRATSSDLPPQVHFTINKKTAFDPKVGHQRVIEQWLLQLLRFIGLTQDIGVSLIYRRRVSGLLGNTRLSVIGPDRSNPCAIGFRAQPGDNGTCVEMHVIFPRNADEFFPAHRAAEGTVTTTGIDAIVALCKEALAGDLLVLDAPAPDEDAENPEEEAGNNVPSTSSLLSGLEKRLSLCIGRREDLKRAIEEVNEAFDRDKRLVSSSRGLGSRMPERMRDDFAALVEKHLASLDEEKQVAALEMAEDVERLRLIKDEIAKIERAIAALRE